MTEFLKTVPILRSFDEVRAREFYMDYLGFTVDWEHRFAPGLPLYMQISRAGLVLHVSEHHGDGTPGSVVFVEMAGLRDFHAEVRERPYRFLRPDIVEAPWDAWCMEVIDPFGNRIRFSEPKARAAGAAP